MERLLVPYSDSLEFIATACTMMTDYDVAFAIIRHDDDHARYARYQKASVAIDDLYKRNGKRAEFVYANVTKEIEEMSKKLSSSTDLKVDASNLVGEMYASIARAQGRKLMLPVNISDLYLGKIPPHDLISMIFRKEEVYRICGKNGIDQNLINEFQILDVERIKKNGDGLTFKEIEWAHEELLEDGWNSNLTQAYTDKEREALQWVWNRKNLLCLNV